MNSYFQPFSMDQTPQKPGIQSVYSEDTPMTPPRFQNQFFTNYSPKDFRFQGNGMTDVGTFIPSIPPVGNMNSGRQGDQNGYGMRLQQQRPTTGFSPLRPFATPTPRKMAYYLEDEETMMDMRPNLGTNTPNLESKKNKVGNINSEFSFSVPTPKIKRKDAILPVRELIAEPSQDSSIRRFVKRSPPMITKIRNIAKVPKKITPPRKPRKYARSPGLRELSYLVTPVKKRVCEERTSSVEVKVEKNHKTYSSSQSLSAMYPHASRNLLSDIIPPKKRMSSPRFIRSQLIEQKKRRSKQRGYRYEEDEDFDPDVQSEETYESDFVTNTEEESTNEDEDYSPDSSNKNKNKKKKKKRKKKIRRLKKKKTSGLGVGVGVVNKTHSKSKKENISSVVPPPFIQELELKQSPKDVYKIKPPKNSRAAKYMNSNKPTNEGEGMNLTMTRGFRPQFPRGHITFNVSPPQNPSYLGTGGKYWKAGSPPGIGTGQGENLSEAKTGRRNAKKKRGRPKKKRVTFSDEYREDSGIKNLSESIASQQTDRRRKIHNSQKLKHQKRRQKEVKNEAPKSRKKRCKSSKKKRGRPAGQGRKARKSSTTLGSKQKLPRKKILNLVQKIEITEEDMRNEFRMNNSVQRGTLPKNVLSHLKSWFVKNRYKPYPVMKEKQKMMDSTHLSKTQIEDWFTNKRKRVWKPLIERLLEENDIDY